MADCVTDAVCVQVGRRARRIHHVRLRLTRAYLQPQVSVDLLAVDTLHQRDDVSLGSGCNHVQLRRRIFAVRELIAHAIGELRVIRCNDDMRIPAQVRRGKCSHAEDAGEDERDQDSADAKSF